MTVPIWMGAELRIKEAVEGFDKLTMEIGRAIPPALELAATMVANTARATTSFRDRTGALRASIQPGEVMQRSGTFGIIVAAGMPYGDHLEFGTRGHMVLPRRRKALRWIGAGGYHFSSGHFVSGIAPREFMARALEDNEGKFQTIIDDAVGAAIERAGFA